MLQFVLQQILRESRDRQPPDLMIVEFQHKLPFGVLKNQCVSTAQIRKFCLLCQRKLPFVEKRTSGFNAANGDFEARVYNAAVRTEVRSGKRLKLDLEFRLTETS